MACQTNYQRSSQGNQKQVERLEKIEHQLLGFNAFPSIPDF
jgi:hypothetical protein